MSAERAHNGHLDYVNAIKPQNTTKKLFQKNENILKNLVNNTNAAKSGVQTPNSYKNDQTKWTVVPHSKRGRTSPQNQQRSIAKQSKLDNYWLGASTSSSTNRFSGLEQAEKDSEEKQETSAPKIEKPPPIFVSGVSNIQPLRALLEQIAKDEYELKILQGNEVKIMPKTNEKYSAITKALTERNTEFHTYKLKEARNFNVVLRGMHHSTPTDELKTAIESLGHNVVSITNIKQRITKNPLSLFYVCLKPNANNKDIYTCSSLFHTKIEFEPPRKKREVPQCTKCQRYGHTKSFCHRSPRCVKCAGNHHTSECPRKSRSDDVLCVLCEGNHPANYKGCVVYKELQSKHFPSLRKREQIRTTRSLSTNAAARPTYASVAREDFEHPIEVTNGSNGNEDIKELKIMMKSLVEQMSTILNLLTAVVASKTNG